MESLQEKQSILLRLQSPIEWYILLPATKKKTTQKRGIVCVRCSYCHWRFHHQSLCVNETALAGACWFKCKSRTVLKCHDNLVCKNLDCQHPKQKHNHSWLNSLVDSPQSISDQRNTKQKEMCKKESQKHNFFYGSPILTTKHASFFVVILLLCFQQKQKHKPV